VEDNRLGKILLKKGFIREDDLQAVLEEQRGSGARLGTVLIQRKLVEKEKIQDIINAQITEIVLQLFGWKQGTYEFAAQGVPRTRTFRFRSTRSIFLWKGSGSLTNFPS